MTFTDPSGASSTCSVTVADVNLRPECTASDQTVECTSHAGALVTLGGSATDADDPAASLVYQWFVSDASVVLDDPSSPIAGRKYTLDVEAFDSHGNATTASCCVVVPHDQRGGS